MKTATICVMILTPAAGCSQESPRPSSPIVRSEFTTVFGDPLASGLSIADVVENALPSVVRISAGRSGVSGVVVNESGLVVTNAHVVDGTDHVRARFVDGQTYSGSVTATYDKLDLALIQIDESSTFSPIPVGDSDAIRIGEELVVIGFPLGSELGAEPTVSVGILSAKRDGFLQTDAALNPDNSGGPMLDMYGQLTGIVVSRLSEDDSGQPVAGIGFSIPVNVVKDTLSGEVSEEGSALPTPTPSPFPAIGPTPDLPATKTALDAIDAQRRLEEQATRTAIEAEQEAVRYAAFLEATRIAGIPTSTPEPTPTSTPIPPTPTPHPSTFYAEWEAAVRAWIGQGNNYRFGDTQHPDVPSLPMISARQGHWFCLTDFPVGVLRPKNGAPIGDTTSHLMPGTYEYRMNEVRRVDGHKCYLRLGPENEERTRVEMPFGEPFTLYRYHVHVEFRSDNNYEKCRGALYRIGN